MKNLSICIFILILLLFSGVNQAEAFFSVDWGNSWDYDYSPGYVFIGRWLHSNGYFSDEATASNFARDNYIGHDVLESDPYNFRPGVYSVEIVYENAGFSDINTLGYYTDSLQSQIFSGLEGAGTGQRSIILNEEFGLYMHSNYLDGTDWFTDRFDNIAQSGLRLSVNNPQALMYELVPGRQWLIAWEDLDSTNYLQFTDNDYNDMYALISWEIPEPATISLLGLGLFGLAGFRKKR